MTKKNLVHWASFRDLEIIKNLIERRSVTLTAEALGVTQPAISRSIASIEEKSGKNFFIRDKGKLVPTSDALFIYKEINNIFSSLQRIGEHNWASHGNQTIRVMATPIVAYPFLVALTARYLEKRRNTLISISVVNSVDMAHELREGRGDLAIGYADINNNPSELFVQTLLRSKVVCIMNKNHELANKEDITLSDFNNTNVIMYTQQNILTSRISQKFNDAGVNINIIAEVSDSILAINFAKENIGACFVPYFSLMSQLSDILVAQDIGLDIYDEMVITSQSSSLNPYVAEFKEYILEQISVMHKSRL